MVRLLKQLLNNQKGQALAIVLALLAIGGLTIAVSLNYATTNLKGSQIVEEKMDGVYAAGSGVEYALWALQKGLWSVPEGATTSNTTPENINQMVVGIQAQNKGTKTLVLAGWSPITTEHPDYVRVTKSIAWDEGAQAYLYTVNVTWQVQSGSPNVFIEEIGVRIPADYNYVMDSTTRSDNKTVSNPSPPYNPLNVDGRADLLSWPWKDWHSQLRPLITDVVKVYTQTFYITGTESLGGSYALVKTDRGDIGTVGEITGTLYKITARARRPQDGRTTAEIVADLMMMGGVPYIMSWQITN